MTSVSNPFNALYPPQAPGRTKPGSRKPAPGAGGPIRFQGTAGRRPLGRDTVTFGGHSGDDEAKIKEQMTQLKLENIGALPKRDVAPETFRKRAEFNVTGNRDVLNDFLPYRKKLVATNRKAELEKYDKLVDTIQNGAQFYKTPSYLHLMGNLTDLYKSKDLKLIHPESSGWAKFKFRLKNLWLHFRMALSSRFRNKLFMKLAKAMKKEGEPVPQKAVDKVFEDRAEKLTDKSTQYLIAASIAELYQKHPDWVENKLNPPGQRPLKIAVSPLTNGLPMAGQYKFGLNTIWFHAPSIWFEAQLGSHVGAHEFTHALSEKENGEYLDVMSSRQKQEYKGLRDEIKKIYKKQDSGFFTRLNRMAKKLEPSCGVPDYGFFNDMEFLTVSTDTFKHRPENLCKTEPGKKLYALYQDLYGIDPLNDLTQKERSEKLDDFKKTLNMPLEE